MVLVGFNDRAGSDLVIYPSKRNEVGGGDRKLPPRVPQRDDNFIFAVRLNAIVALDVGYDLGGEVGPMG